MKYRFSPFAFASALEMICMLVPCRLTAEEFVEPDIAPERQPGRGAKSVTRSVYAPLAKLREIPNPCAESQDDASRSDIAFTRKVSYCQKGTPRVFKLFYDHLYDHRSRHRMKVRVIKHEIVPDCGSYEVRFPDRRPSKYFYFENLPGRRLRPDRVEQAVAEQDAKRFARDEQDKLDSQ